MQALRRLGQAARLRHRAKGLQQLQHVSPAKHRAHTGMRNWHFPTAAGAPTIEQVMSATLTIESTPDLALLVYARMRRTLSEARRSRSGPLTLAEKVLLSHLDDPCAAPEIRGQ